MIIPTPLRVAPLIVALASASSLWAQHYGPLSHALQAQLPAPVEFEVDFARDIQPIFEASSVMRTVKRKASSAWRRGMIFSSAAIMALRRKRVAVRRVWSWR